MYTYTHYIIIAALKLQVFGATPPATSIVSSMSSAARHWPAFAQVLMAALKQTTSGGKNIDCICPSITPILHMCIYIHKYL